MIVIEMNGENPNSAPAWWDGDSTKDFLRFDRETSTFPGFGHLTSGDVLLVLNEDPRPWPGNPTFVGVDCVFGQRRIWFLVDTSSSRRTAFGYSLTGMA